MKNLINKILKEDWGWVDDVSEVLEIGEPLTMSNPKNMFRVYVQHGHGEDNATWSDNYWSVSVKDIDKVLTQLKILRILAGNGYFYTVQHIVDEVLKGNTEYILDYEAFKSDYDRMIEEEDGDSLFDAISEALSDWGMYEYDSYSGDAATLENYKITYFDEFGVEHKVKINYDLL